MKHGPLLFLGLLFALALSWWGMIAVPQFQFGGQQPTNVPPANVLYPTPYPGLAQLGREVYRANGCAYCHTQVIRQEGTRFEVVMTNPGTNETAVAQEVAQLRKLPPNQAFELLQSTPLTVLSTPEKTAADDAQERLGEAGAEVSVRVIPTGPDIERGWGSRMTVGHDYLYDAPLMLGTTRLGPDLTNVGLRQPDPGWHLVHLYDPRLKVPGSTMPRYPFLFETKPRLGKPSPNALPIPGDIEVLPTREATALAAYLVSLRADLPLFEAPAPQVGRAATAETATGETNQPATPSGSVNPSPSGPPTNAPAVDQGTAK